MFTKYLAVKHANCEVCGDVPHYQISEGGVYFCRHQILALAKEQRERETRLHVVEGKGEAAA
jgi:hypothetical protein